MTVKEVIQDLSKLPEDLEVLIEKYGGQYKFTTIEQIGWQNIFNDEIGEFELCAIVSVEQY